MQDYSLVCGQVRALEASIFNQNHLERMVGASNLSEAFKVLVELQYAKYISEKTNEHDFLEIIRKGLEETKQLLVSSTSNDPALQILWLPIDVNNIKRAIKQKKEGLTVISEFTEEEGYSTLGSLSLEQLNALVFEKKPNNVLGESFQLGVFKILEKSEKQDIACIEQDLDQLLYKSLITQTEEVEYSDALVAEAITKKIDATNLRNLARSVILRDVPAEKESFITGGSFHIDAFEKNKEPNSAIKYIKSHVSTPLTFGEGSGAGALFIRDLDLLLEKEYLDFLYEKQLGAISSILVPLYYFEKRLQNARHIKFIMFAKEQGLTPDEIYKALDRL